MPIPFMALTILRIFLAFYFVVFKKLIQYPPKPNQPYNYVVHAQKFTAKNNQFLHTKTWNSRVKFQVIMCCPSVNQYFNQTKYIFQSANTIAVLK